MRSFISFNKLIECNKLDEFLDFETDSLYIKKELDDGTVKFYSANNFESDLSSLMRVKSFTDMLVIEVNSDKLKSVEEKDLDKYEEIKSGVYKKIFYKYETDDVALINYSCLSGMTLYDMELGKIVAVKKDKNNNFYITDRLHNSRTKLQSKAVGSDLYFYTENEDLLEKYKDSRTEFKNNGTNKYSLTKHRIAVIDSISQSRVNDFTFNTYMRFRELCDSSTKVSIEVLEDKFKLEILNTISSRDKKGYIISNSNFSNMLYDPSMEPLLNYINIYELDSDSNLYRKTPIKEYLKDHTGVKSYKNKNYRRVEKRAA